MKKFSYVKVRDVKSPSRGTPLSAGLDFYVPNDLTLEQIAEKNPLCPIFESVDGHFQIGPYSRILIPSGLHFKLPEGTALIAFNKSGVATKRSLVVGACVVDADYEGECHISLINTSNSRVEIARGEKIVQFLLLDVNYDIPNECSSLDELYHASTSVRGSGGFGSTGDK